MNGSPPAPAPTQRSSFFENSESYLYNLVTWLASRNRPEYVTVAIRPTHA